MSKLIFSKHYSVSIIIVYSLVHHLLFYVCVYVALKTINVDIEVYRSVVTASHHKNGMLVNKGNKIFIPVSKSLLFL